MRAFVCWLVGHKPFRKAAVKIKYRGKTIGFYTPKLCTRCWKENHGAGWRTYEPGTGS